MYARIGIYPLCKRWHLERNMKVYAEMDNMDKAVRFMADVKPNNKMKPLLWQFFFSPQTLKYCLVSCLINISLAKYLCHWIMTISKVEKM